MRTRPIEYKELENGCFECTSHIPNKNGYPQLMNDGKVMKVRDFVYIKNVDFIGDDEEVLQTCGNKLCINLDHLSKNKKVPIRFGSRNSNAVLNEDLVADIKKLFRNSKSVSEISKMLNINRSTLYNIKNGHAWGHIK